ncbi:FAD-binding molybdopterin dehydrogenase [Mycolicibacterium sp. 018/SC-01/001]|uniref:FAD binding domain-containing protein n=1 Tax=Mycolicibacterium sp. 018/SC-01/001 TaxID=2592069 RepID=UPI00117C1DCB|nr:FAD binding domain-containing protein [Mycolicibacterium sp. 018/SC-01/001]TRW85363.1 FAD-binding molybdopterin dehydrogenase [Mycolicibacterium sp. 018/SC-01/001]
MDLNTVEAVHTPRRRDEVWPLGTGDAILAGGTWLFSEPQPHVTRLVDITALGWPPITLSDNGIEIAATCTLADVTELSTTLPARRSDWTAAPLFAQCSSALVAGFKIWRTATVGGNICLSLPAGSMISLATALDATALIWRADGNTRTVPVADFVTGVTTNVLSTGDVMRSLHIPAAALRARTAYRKIASSPLGRSGAVVIGRHDAPADGDAITISVTAATVRPYVLRLGTSASPDTLHAALAVIPDDAWLRDPHGDPDWRAAMTRQLAEQILTELTC